MATCGYSCPPGTVSIVNYDTAAGCDSRASNCTPPAKTRYVDTIQRCYQFEGTYTDVYCNSRWVGCC